MKKILSIILTLVLILSMSMTAFAAESHDVIGNYVTASEGDTVYAVDIAWGSMEFAYEVPADVWNSEEHKYESGGDAQWEHSDGANMVTVTNRSNAAVTVTVTTNVKDSNITASVENGSFILGSAAEGATTSVAGTETKGTAAVTLSGTLTDKEAKKAVIGSVTVTVVDSEASALPESEINAAIEALKNGETITLNNVSPANHAAIVAAVDAVSDGALMSTTVQGLSTTYSLKSDFAGAVLAWTEGTTLTMLGNTDTIGETFVSYKGMILDLNGYSISATVEYTGDATIHVEESGELTIRDSGGTGSVGGTNTYYSLSVDGICTLESGTMNGQVDTINCFYMNGGKVIYDGSVIWMRASMGGCVRVTGGEIIGTQIRCDNRDTNEVTVTGGTFSFDPSIDVDTEYYTVTNNGDGTWTVTAK